MWQPILTTKKKEWQPVLTPTQSAPSPAPKSQESYFYGQTPRGYTFGRADEIDTSGRPYLAYRKPGDTSTTTDKTRVATKFTPILALPTTKENVYNPRGVANEQAVKQSLGYRSGKDNLDHVMALAVSGSNNPANLRVVPKEQNTDGDLANQSLKDVQAGKKSLFQAQTDFALAKKTPLPETGSRYGILKQAALQAEEEAKKTKNIGGLLKNTIKAIPSALAKQVGQPILQSAAIATEKLRTLNPNATFTPKTQFQKELLGTDKPLDFTAKGEELGIKNKKIAPIVGGLLVAGDLIPGGGSKKGAQQAFNAEKYIAEQVTKRAAAKVAGSPGVLSKSKSFLADAKSKLVDFTAPIEDTLAEAQKKSKFSLLPEHDIHNQIDRVLRAPTLAGQFAKDHGIVDVIRKVDNPDALDQYMIAKHAIELDTRGITTGRDMAKDTALIKALAPKYEAQAQQVGNYARKLLDYSVDTGLVSKETADMLKARYPDYVPFNRVFSEIEKEAGQGTKAVASLSKQTAVQKIVGSEREIESPLQSLLAKTNDVFKQGEKNQAGKLLASYEKLPGNPFQLKEGAGDHTISFFDNGVKKTFTTTPEISEAAKALNVQQINVLGKILAFPVRVARLGITGVNLPFLAANFAKDQATAFINSDQALRSSIANPINFGKSLFAAVGHGNLYDEMVRAGGAGTSYDIARNQVEQTFDRIRAGRGLLSRAGYTVRHPSELLRAVENLVGRGEEMTRIQQYEGAKQGLLKQGLDKKNATIGAARAARDNTVNFARRGEWGTVLNSAFLYLNAGIQGTRTLLRNAKNKPAQTATKIAVSTLFPTAAITAWNLNDPERKKAYEDIPEYEKENNLIIIPPNPTQDEKGYWNVIKIPLSQGINNLTTLVRKPMEQAYELDPVKFKDIAQSLIGTVSPINPTKGSVLSTVVPQAVKPTIEAAVNQSLFTGNPIVPEGLSRLSPEKQIKADTSDFAIKLGGQLGVSPAQIDAFVKSTFGGVGAQITGQQSVKEAVLARFTKARGGEVANKVYENQQALSQEKADVRAEFKASAYQQIQDLVKQGKKEEAQKMVESLSEADYEIYKGIKTGERAKRTSELRGLLNTDPQRAVTFVRSQDPEEQKRLVNVLTDEEYDAYTRAKNSIIKP